MTATARALRDIEDKPTTAADVCRAQNKAMMMDDWHKQNAKLYPLRPGEKLRCVASKSQWWTKGKVYVADKHACIWGDWPDGACFAYPKPVPHLALFERVTPADEWTPENNTTPYGLLTDEQREALKAAKHGWVRYTGAKWVRYTGVKWADKEVSYWAATITYRAKPAPQQREFDATHEGVRYRITTDADGMNPEIEVVT